MSVRELVVLGTSSQVPTRYRNHNGYLLLWDGMGVLFDPGEGTQRQMLLAGVRSHQVHRIAVTHFHGDHCLGLPGILQRISLDEVPHPVEVHFPASGRAFYDRLKSASIYLDKATIVPRPHSAPEVIGGWPGVRLRTRQLDHAADAWGYRIDEDDGWTCDSVRAAAAGVRGPAIGRLLREGSVEVDGRVVRVEEVATRRPGQSFAFLMDTRPCAAALDLARGVDMLVCESTYLSSEAREAHDHGHMTAADAARLAREARARRLVLTHFSQRYPLVDPFLAEARALHPDVVAAVD
ncbi:MAG TPA: ribonuclease Z, partial [Myxococcota bacterium]|nr:ribonuclease Z [Myxococcota bacterium]